MLDENLIWIIEWYNTHCDANWEHQFGLKIQTLDNPGWGIDISIQDTELEDKKFEEISMEHSEHDWLFCIKRDGIFEGNCGPFNFPEILLIFRKWAEDPASCSNLTEKMKRSNNDNLIWLLNWFHSQCDGDWEHGNGIQIGTIDNPGWYLKICLDETELQDKSFQKIRIDRSEDDWIQCFIENKIFQGVGGPSNFPEILQIFRDWAESE